MKDLGFGLAKNWIKAWNAHHLDRILAHNAEDVELVSPMAVERLGVSDGIDALVDCQRFGLLYENPRGTRTAEYMEVSSGGKVSRVVANYNG